MKEDMKIIGQELFRHGKRLFEMARTNILYIIWLIIYFRWSHFVIQPFFGRDLVGGFVFTLMLYAVSLTIAYFFGDEILKLIEGVRPLETKREKEYLTPLFEEVYEDVKEIYPEMPEVKLHIVDTLSVNAMAIGNRTIAVTQGAVETFTSEELQGVMAHEMSHIYYGDTKAIIMNTIGNGIATIAVLGIKLFLRLLERIFGQREFGVIFTLFRFILETWVFLLLWFGRFILSFNSRANEFKADKFAYETGYGKQLTEALYILQKMSLGQKVKLVHRLQASHPRTSKRIGRLEALEDGEI